MTLEELYMKGYDDFLLEVIDNRGEVITHDYGNLYHNDQFNSEEVLYFTFEVNEAPYIGEEGEKYPYKVVAHLLNSVRYKVN